MKESDQPNNVLEPGSKRSLPEILTHYEVAILESLGLKISRTSLSFHRELAEEELREAWRTIAAIRRRVPDDQDWADWLIGDWYNHVVDRLDEKSAEQIVLEETTLARTTEHIFHVSGVLLLSLQKTEQLISLCCDCLAGTPIQVEEIFTANSPNRRRTLGQLSRRFQKEGLFVGDLERRLDAFVDSRNRFTHRMWTEDVKSAVRVHDENMARQKSLLVFMTSLIREAEEMYQVFRGLYGAVGVHSASTGGGEDLRREILATFGEDIRRFEAVLRDRQSGDA